VRCSIKAIQGPRLDSEVFKPGSVPAATLAVTERLRQQGTTGPELSTARIEELKSLASERRRAGGRAAVRLAVERVIEGPAGPLGLRVLSSGKVRACYLHVHGGAGRSVARTVTIKPCCGSRAPRAWHWSPSTTG
jgi:hypothetical protein